MIQEKRLKLASLLLKGLSVDEAKELTDLLKEEQQESHSANRLDILKGVKQSFSYFSDGSTKCHGYQALCDEIEKLEKV